MHILSSKQAKERSSADMTILPFWQGKKHAEAACVMTEFSSLIKAPIDSGDFLGKEGETLLLYPQQGKEKRVLLLGLGNKEKCTKEVLRRSYAGSAKCALKKKNTDMNIFLPDSKSLSKKDICYAVSEAVFLTNYTFNDLKGQSAKEDPATLLKKVTFVGLDKADLSLCKKAFAIVASVHYARDLINGNADEITPQVLSKKAKELTKEFPKIKTTVFDKKRIEAEKMGLLLAVNRGSTIDPAFIILEYRGALQSKEVTAIVGKGITYDTGGLNIKSSGMETMKCDMSGAAAVLGTLRAAATIGLKANIIGIVPSTDNAVGPNSYKPGDVYKSLSGKTVEISNTDAEGRLVLADALTYVQNHFAPTRIIDLATLTGSIVLALGEELTGLFSNEDALAKDLLDAGERCGERLWRMPLVAEYNEMLKSPYADLQNAAGRKAGSITAALFLQNFIKNTPWAHLDIAGTAFTDPKHYNPSKATGVGVRLLIDFLEN